MGNALIMLTVPEETFIGWSQDGSKLRLEIPREAVWAMPEEPWKKLGLDWHWKRQYLEGHRDHVRKSLSSFMNGVLSRLDGMARSGWFVVEKTRCSVRLRERPHGELERRERRRKKRTRRGDR